MFHPNPFVSKRVLRKQNTCIKAIRGKKMTDKTEKEDVSQHLERMIKEKADQPIEKTLAIFCERHGISMDKCREYYKELLEKNKTLKK